MPASVTFNGTTYLLPTAGETGWATNVTNFLSDVGNNSITLAASQTLTNKNLRLQAGAVGSPSLSFAANTTTGIYQPATNQIAFATNGVQRAIINGAGVLQLAATPSAHDNSLNVATTAYVDNATTVMTGVTSLQLIEPSNNVNTLQLTNTGSFGANIKLIGNGATTPNKTIRVQAGSFQIVNHAYNAVPLLLTDAGDLSLSGAMTAAGIATAAQFIVANASGYGTVQLQPGSGHTGYLGLFNSSGTRQGYVGFGDGTRNYLNTENGTTTWQVNGNFITTGTTLSTGLMTSNVGYSGKAGTAGGLDGHTINHQWDGTGCVLWIDAVPIGYISTSSDVRFKHHITEMSDSALDRILKLKPISYRWQDKLIYKDDFLHREGFAAQDVKSIIPSAVNETDSEHLSLNPLPLIAVLTKAVQELSAKVTQLESRHA